MYVSSMPGGPGQLDAGSADPRRPARAVFFVLFTLSSFGVWMAITTPASVTLALRVTTLDPHNQATVYSVLSGIGALVAVIANPLFGRFSDRTRSRWGRRKPWVVVGLVGTAAGAALIAFSHTVPLLVVGWMLMQFFINAAVAGQLAYIADRFPEHQHGILGSISGAAYTGSLILGVFFIAWFPTQILPQIGLPVLAAFITTALLLLVMKENGSRTMERRPFGVKEFLGSFAINPRKSPNFGWFLIALFLMSASTVGLATYHVYFMQGQLHVSGKALPNALVVWSMLNSIAALIAAPIAGWVSDRIRRPKPMFIASAILGAVSVAIIVLAPSLPVFIVGSTIEGLSAGALSGVYYVFATSTMNDPTTIARDLGVTNIALTLPSSLIPFAAPFILNIGGHGDNYPLLFIIGGVVGLLALPVLALIRPNRDTLTDELIVEAKSQVADSLA